MDYDRIYIYRIVVGIILWFSNNEYTWKIINYLSNINGNVSVKFVVFFRNILILISLLGIVITYVSAISLFKLTLSKKKK